MHPIFSAAYSDRFDAYTRQRRDASRDPLADLDASRYARARWRRELRVDGDALRWGYYLDDGREPETEEQPGVPAEAHGRASGTQRVARPGSSSHAPAGHGLASSHGAVAPRPPFSSVLPRRRDMAVKTYTWVSLWFLITIPVIFWDSGYLFLRPRSFEGGDLHWLWEPYTSCLQIYGLKAWDEGDGFPAAQALLNVVENILNIAYLYMAHVRKTPTATLVGFMSITMTLSKTALYWLQEYLCGGCSVGHNNLRDLLLLWVIPNGLWLLVPSLVLWRLGKDINESLHFTTKAAKKVSSGKTQ